MKPRLLDLFCGAGGASVGYHRAGFDVTGVDINPMPNYPYEFIQADALEYLAEHGREYDAIHASPPCQAYSTITPDHSRHPRLIAPIRMMLRYLDIPYVIENVEGARRDLDHPIKLCGSSFGLRVRRHRYFETTAVVMQYRCEHARQGRPIGIYGDHPQDDRDYRRPDGTRRGSKAVDVDDARDAMGIDWMNWRELAQSIPPAYTEYIGTQLHAALADVRLKLANGGGA